MTIKELETLDLEPLARVIAKLVHANAGKPLTLPMNRVFRCMADESSRLVLIGALSMCEFTVLRMVLSQVKGHSNPGVPAFVARLQAKLVELGFFIGIMDASLGTGTWQGRYLLAAMDENKVTMI